MLCGPGVASSPCRSLGDTLLVDDFGPAGASFLLFASTALTSVPVPPFGTLLIGPTPILAMTGVLPYPGLSGPDTRQFPIPNDLGLRGLALHFQSLGILTSTNFQLSNRATSLLR